MQFTGISNIVAADNPVSHARCEPRKGKTARRVGKLNVFRVAFKPYRGSRASCRRRERNQVQSLQKFVRSEHPTGYHTIRSGAGDPAARTAATTAAGKKSQIKDQRQQKKSQADTTCKLSSLRSHFPEQSLSTKKAE